MIIVPVKNSSSLEQALKQYKLKIYKTKQLEKLRERQEFVKKSIEVKPNVPKASNPIVSTKILGGLYFPQVSVLINKHKIKERLHNKPINLLDEIPPLAPSIIFLKNLIINLDIVL